MEDSMADLPVQGPRQGLANRPRPPPLDNTDWKYRGRTGSEGVQGEPLSAPSGLSAQQSEGFQRFYKAVVSPTHVRVTAGGRIVPNTRGISPSAKLSKDKQSAEPEPAPTTASAATGNLENKPRTPQPTLQPAPPIFPAAARMIPQFVPPVSFMPLAYPYGVAAGGYQLPHPALAATHHMHQTMAHAAAKDSVQTPIGASDGSVEEKNGGVKISPPDQFDFTRPFVYNGQWVLPSPMAYPQPIHAPYMPMNWMGTPGMPQAPLPGGMLPTGPAGVGGMPNHVGFQMPAMTLPQAMTAQAQSAMPQPYPTAQQPPVPPVSSIRASEITRKQLDCLRSALKYYEDQLQYNRHQIDEKHIEHQANTVRVHIEQFERTLKSQLAAEEVMYPKGEKNNEGSGSNGSRGGTASKSSASSENAANNGSDEGMKQYGGQRAKKQKIGINPSTKMPKCAFNLASYQGGKIPSHAALAQPFQPQAGSFYPIPQKIAAEDDEFYQDHQQPLEEVERRLLAASTEYWGHTSSSFLSNTDGAKSGGSEDAAASTAAPAAISQQPKNLKAWESGRPGHPDVPYLVGTLPRGVNPRTAKDTDYVYHRELTEDEICARHLYWGKAPRSVTQGLPKFDGKHFYPPSPVKETAALNPEPEAKKESTTVGGDAETDYGVKTPAAEMSDPFGHETAAKSDHRPPSGLYDGHSQPEEEDYDDFHISTRSCRQMRTSTDDSQQSLKDSKRETASESKASDIIEAEAKSPRRKEKRSSDKAPYVTTFHDSTPLGKLSTNVLPSHSSFIPRNLWQNMFKRGTTTGMAAPSAAVSSTMAHGILPPYSSGHAAASLATPCITSAASCPSPRSSPSKSIDLGESIGGGAPLTSPGPAARRDGRDAHLITNSDSGSSTSNDGGGAPLLDEEMTGLALN